MAICSDTVTSLYTGFCPQLNIYFHVMQLNRWLHLSCSLWEIPLRWDLFKKLIDQKISFIATKNWIVLAVWWSVKYFFAPNFPSYQKGWTKRIQAIAMLLQLGFHSGNDIHHLGRRNLIAPDSSPKVRRQSILTATANIQCKALRLVKKSCF